MAIKTSTFGNITLSGKAAEAFKRHFLNPVSNPAAKKLLEDGEKLLKQMENRGIASVNPKKKC